MAFNPFATFRKYQKYWMAAAVLVCMLTFVLCSGGMKGTGLDDWLMMLTRRRGEEYARINNRRYTYEDMQELKNQRNVANEFMRELTKLGYDKLVLAVKNMKSQEAPVDANDPEQQRRMAIFTTCMQDLADKYREPRYFHGGTKLDDLVEFILWRDLADKYGVTLTDEVVKDLVNQAVHAGQLWLFDSDTSRELQYKLRMTHANASDSGIFKAVRDEFRVQILQLAFIGKWSPGQGVPTGMGQMRYERDILGDQYKIFINTPMQHRVVPTPEQISAHYRKVRTELTIDLLPVSLEQLAKKEKLPEDRAQRLEVLKNFYEKFARDPFNPMSDKPGFVFPERAEIQYMMAEPTMPYYKDAAEAVIALEKTPPVAMGVLNPFVQEIGWLASQPAWTTSLLGRITQERERFLASLQSRYETLKLLSAEINKTIPDNAETKDKLELVQRQMQARQRYEFILSQPTIAPKYGLSPLTTPYFWNPEKFNDALAKPSATAVTAVLGGLAGSDGAWSALLVGNADAYFEQFKQIEPMLAVEKTKRIKVGLDLVLAQTPDLFGTSAFTAAAMTYYADLQPQFEPVAGFLEADLTKNVEKTLAQNAMNAIMLDCKKQLEAFKGRDAAFNARLKELQRQYSRQVVDKDGQTRTLYGFELNHTAKARNAYDVDQDPALQPLLASFNKNRFFVNSIEGRSGKPEMLKESDFNKLFFGTDTLGVGNQDTFVPKVWPPYVSVPKQQLENPLLTEKSREQRLFDKDEKPFIFWKSSKLPQAALPWDSWVEDFAEKQYRMYQARNRLMDEVKRLAEAVRLSQRAEGKDVRLDMQKLAAEHGTQVIVLKDVAQLVENKNRGPLDDVNYVEYSLPTGKIPYPREDMVKDLLKLYNLPAPLKFEDMKDLSDLNEKLFDKNIKPGSTLGQLQVLTNKPRTVYYLSMVTDVKPAEMFNYFENVLPQAAATGRAQNKFVDQVQTEYGRELLRQTLEDLKRQADVYVSDAARKQFAETEQAQQQ